MNLYESIKGNLKNLNESEKKELEKLEKEIKSDEEKLNDKNTKWEEKTDLEQDIKYNKKQVAELEKKENLTEGTKQKRISRYGEVDNGYVLHNYEEMSDEEAEQKAKESSEKDKWDIYYVAYDDVMNPGSNLRWYRGKSYTPEEAHAQLIKDKKENAKKFRDFVDNQLRSGAIDDPEHVNSLSDKEYEDLLVNTWMQDKDMIKAFKDMNESESSYYNKDSEDFEDLVKRDFKLYLDDVYGDEEYKNVTEEDVNNYFTGLFYDIFDNDDIETANAAEDIIRKEYGLQDKLNESEKDVKDQIKFVCKIDNIPADEDFINFVYNKHLDGFSGEIMKKLREEYDKSKSKNEAEVEEHDLSKDLFGDEAANRMSQKEKDLERDLQYVRDIMAGKTVIDDKYHEELNLDTAKAWLRKDFIYVNCLSAYSPDEINKRLADEYPDIFSINEAEETQTETSEPIMIYMNTWKNYNEYGADLESYGIKDGWMTPEQALEFCKKYAEDEPFINDVDNNSGIDLEISEYSNAPSVLEGLVKLNDAMTFGAGNADKDDIGLLWEAWADKESASTPSIENIEEFLDFLENGEYYVHNDITSTYDIGKYYVDNVGFEGVSNIENYINTNQVKEDLQEEIDNEYEKDSEDWFEYDDSMIDEIIDSYKAANDENFFDKYFDYESLGDEIYSDGYWYLTDNGSVEIY